MCLDINPNSKETVNLSSFDFGGSNPPPPIKEMSG